MKYFTFFIVLFCISCGVKPDREVSYYYDTDSLLQEQKKMLLQRNAKIIKKAVVEGEAEQDTIWPDSLAIWNREFQIFEKININKPALRGLYQIREYDDIKSNLKVREYTSLEKELEVPYLKIYYLNKPANIWKIEAKYVEDNPIYKSERHLTFIFDDHTGSPLLDKYMVRGTQKMILKDRVTFEVSGEVRL